PHQEHGPEHAAAQDRAGEPPPLTSGNARAFASTQQKQKCEANAGAEVKQAREEPRIDFAEQQLGERRARAEEQRRAQRRRHAAVESGYEAHAERKYRLRAASQGTFHAMPESNSTDAASAKP